MARLVSHFSFLKNPFSADNFPYNADNIPYLADNFPYIADDRNCSLLKSRAISAFFGLKLIKTLKTRQKLATSDKNSSDHMTMVEAVRSKSSTTSSEPQRQKWLESVENVGVAHVHTNMG